LVDGVHFCEFSKIDHEDGCFDNFIEVHVVRAENGPDVFQNANGLFGDTSLDKIAGDRVQWDLARAVESISNGDGLGIGAHRCRGFGGGYHFSHRNRSDYPSGPLCKDGGAFSRGCKMGAQALQEGCCTLMFVQIGTISLCLALIHRIYLSEAERC